MADPTYTAKVYHQQSGNGPVDTEVVADSGQIKVEGGGEVQFSGGAILNASEGFQFLLGGASQFSGEILGNFMRSHMTRWSMDNASMGGDSVSVGGLAGSVQSLTYNYGTLIIATVQANESGYICIQSVSKGDTLKIICAPDNVSNGTVFIANSGAGASVSIQGVGGSRLSSIIFSMSGTTEYTAGDPVAWITMKAFDDNHWSIVESFNVTINHG